MGDPREAETLDIRKDAGRRPPPARFFVFDFSGLAAIDEDCCQAGAGNPAQRRGFPPKIDRHPA
jgi:hypothetical protein